MKRIPVSALIAILVFLVSMGFLFISDMGNVNNIVFIVCGVYGLVCLLFLFFQLYAFVKAHTEYNEDVEKIKYKVFEVEGISLNEISGDYEKELV